MSNLFAEFKQAAIVNTLRRCRLFMYQPALDFNSIAAHTVIKPLSKGDFLFCEGSPVHGFYIVQSGAIKLYRVNRAGREQVIHVFRTHESFAEESLLSEQGHLAHARAAEESRVLLVQKNGFIALLKRQPDLTLCLLRALGEHLSGVIGLVDDLTLKDVKTRLANWLVQHCPDPDSSTPVEIELPSTKHMLASELGTGSETLSRTFAIFRNQKLLSVAGKRITLLCPSKLARLSGIGQIVSARGIPGLDEFGSEVDDGRGEFEAPVRRKVASRNNRCTAVLQAV